MKNEHTPGPYPLTVTKVDESFVVVTNQGNHFAKTFDPCVARLISASPELLAALETAVEWLEAAQADQPDDWKDPAMDAAVESARSAIAKAKGNR